VWDWKQHTVIQDIDLGEEGMIPLELRFLHDPDETQGYVGAALSSNVFRFHRTMVGQFAVSTVTFNEKVMK
jgi:selenium-binding protein 1